MAIGPHGPSALGKLEFSVPFTEAEDTLGRQLEVHLEVLVHDVAGLVDGGDQSLASVGAANLEAEWVHVQLEVRHVKSVAGIRVHQANDAAIRLPPFLVGVLENHTDGTLLDLTELEGNAISNSIVHADWHLGGGNIDSQIG